MKLILTDSKLARRALRVLTAVGCLLTAGVSLGETPSMLTYAWRAEATRPAEVAVTIRQGETIRLACTLLERAKPIAVPDDASSRFFWRDADAKGNYWAKEATRQGSELAFVWSGACDVGAKRYDFVFSLESPTAGTLYRASGVLIMQSSPGFNPASLQPPDVFAEIVEAAKAAVLEVAATQADLQAEAAAREAADTALQAELSAAFAAALQAEAEAREAADEAITEAVNAQAGVLEQHQGYLSTLSTNYNNLASSYIQSVTDLQKADAALESALATKAEAEHTHAMDDVEGLQGALDAKAEASALSAHAATWATGSTGGHVKLGTNSILSTADGNFGVVGKTSGNQLIYRLDAAPTENSGLPVKSGGVYTALAAKAALEHTHSQYLTSYTESDPTIAAWAKAATKPTYTAAEVGAQPAGKYVTYDTTSHSLDAVSKETSFAGGIRTDSFKTLYGTPFFNTVSDYGFNITGFYRLNGYRKTDKPLLEWDVSTQQSSLDVTNIYENGTLLSNKYAPISHAHTVSAITDFPTTWDWANLTNKPTTFPAEAHNHDGTYLKLTGGTVTGNVTFNGTGNYVNALIFGGTAQEAGLKVRGIWGKPSGNTNQKAELYLNIPLQSEGNVGTAAYFSTPGYGVYIRGGWGTDSERINYLALRRIDGDTLYAAKTHTHAIAETTGLQAALDGLAAAEHTHAIAETTGLQAALDGLAPLSSVTCTTNAVTYIWQWDEEAGTFALVERE